MAWSLCQGLLVLTLFIFRYDDIQKDQFFLVSILLQKFVRKHQLSSTMRKQLQTFLSGFSMAGTCSLGCINWQLDPTILGLERETDFSMEYR